MELLAKKKSQRISVWLLIFAMVFTIVSTSLILPAHAENFLGNAREGGAMSDVGEAISDVGEGMSEAVSDLGDMGDAEDGKVSDSDGFIGNEESETDGAKEERGGMGWLALVITLVVVLIVIVLIILLIPKKRDR